MRLTAAGAIIVAAPSDIAELVMLTVYNAEGDERPVNRSRQEKEKQGQIDAGPAGPAWYVLCTGRPQESRTRRSPRPSATWKVRITGAFSDLSHYLEKPPVRPCDLLNFFAALSVKLLHAAYLQYIFLPHLLLAFA